MVRFFSRALLNLSGFTTKVMCSNLGAESQRRLQFEYCVFTRWTLLVSRFSDFRISHSEFLIFFLKRLTDIFMSMSLFVFA